MAQAGSCIEIGGLTRFLFFSPFSGTAPIGEAALPGIVGIPTARKLLGHPASGNRDPEVRSGSGDRDPLLLREVHLLAVVEAQGRGRGLLDGG